MAKSTINPTVYNQLYRNQVNRGEQTREDDDYIKIPEITIYDVDYSILQYIRNSINIVNKLNYYFKYIVKIRNI